MPIHVFVDESKARGLVLAAAACRANEVTAYRKELRGLLLPGQERLHFNHESTARRRKIIGLIAQLDLSIGIYQVARDDRAGRQACLQAVVRDIAGTAHRLIIERDESTYDFDKRTLTAAIAMAAGKRSGSNCSNPKRIHCSGYLMPLSGAGFEVGRGGSTSLSAARSVRPRNAKPGSPTVR